MSNDRRDEKNRLLGPILHELYRQELAGLGGESCLQRLNDRLEDQWRSLAVESARLHDRPAPNEDDSLSALDAIEFQLSDGVSLPDLTLPQIWRIARRTTLRRWKIVTVSAIAFLGFLIGIAYWCYSRGVNAGREEARNVPAENARND